MKVGAVGVPFAPRLLKPNGEPDEIVEEATTLEIIVLKPNGELVTWEASLYPDEPGRLLYTTQAGDIDVAGRYSFELRIVTPTLDFRSDVGTFVAEAQLEAAA